MKSFGRPLSFQDRPPLEPLALGTLRSIAANAVERDRYRAAGRELGREKLGR